MAADDNGRAIDCARDVGRSRSERTLDANGLRFRALEWEAVAAPDARCSCTRRASAPTAGSRVVGRGARSAARRGAPSRSISAGTVASDAPARSRGVSSGRDSPTTSRRSRAALAPARRARSSASAIRAARRRCSPPRDSHPSASRRSSRSSRCSSSGPPARAASRSSARASWPARRAAAAIASRRATRRASGCARSRRSRASTPRSSRRSCAARSRRTATAARAALPRRARGVVLRGRRRARSLAARSRGSARRCCSCSASTARSRRRCASGSSRPCRPLASRRFPAATHFAALERPREVGARDRAFLGLRRTRRSRGGSTRVIVRAWRSRVILHADMDAFYASVEQRDRPELRGKPVIVGGTRAARRRLGGELRGARLRRALGDAGLRGAAPLSRRRSSCAATCASTRRCRAGVRDLRALLAARRADLARRGVPRSHRHRAPARPPRVAGEALRRAVREATGLAVSVGIAPTKMVAKIASDEAKPDGLCEVSPEEVRAFLDPLPVGRALGRRSGRRGAAARGRHRDDRRARARATPSGCARCVGESLGAHAAALARGAGRARRGRPIATRSRTARRTPSTPTSSIARASAP